MTAQEWRYSVLAQTRSCAGTVAVSPLPVECDSLGWSVLDDDSSRTSFSSGSWTLCVPYVCSDGRTVKVDGETNQVHEGKIWAPVSSYYLTGEIG